MLQPNLRAEGKGFAAPVLANIKHSQFTCVCGIKFDGAIEAIVAKETHLNHMRIELNRQAIYGARAMYKRLTNIKPPPTRLHITGNCMLTIGHADVQQDEVNLWAYDLLSLMHLHYTIEHIYTGGQTGVDTAVAAAAMLLNIPLTVTYPEGFLQRQQNGQLINFTQEQVAANLQAQMDSLKLRLKLIENLK